MKYTEFEIISKFFQRNLKKDSNEIIGIRDYSAIISIVDHYVLAISTDTLVEETHFFKNISPNDLAYKAVAVNLSDLVSMGDYPKWITLSITIPKSKSLWLKKFSDSFFNVLDNYNIRLIGDDTNRSTLSITLSVYGLLKKRCTIKK